MAQTFEVLGDDVFEQLQKQIECGNNICRRVAHYLKKASNAQLSYAKEIEKITKSEEGKLKQYQDDAMMRHVAATLEVQSVTMSMAQRMKTLAEETIQSVAEPLEQFYKTAEKKKEQIVSQHQKAQRDIKDLRANVEKERRRCIAHFEDCVKERNRLLEEQSKGASGNVDKFQARLQKERENAQAQFQKFEALRVEALAKIDTFYSTTVPELMKQLTEMEAFRMDTLKLHLDHYSGKQVEATSEIPTSAKFADMVKKLNASSEISGLVMRLNATNPNSTNREPLDVKIPCSSKRIMDEDWHTGGDPDAPAGIASSSPNAAAAKPKPPKPAGAPPTEMKIEAAVDSGVPAIMWVRAVYDYPQGQPGDLTFGLGNYIKVTDTGTGKAEPINPSAPAWWAGEVLGSLVNGRFPNNYMEEIKDQSIVDALHAAVANAEKKAPEIANAAVAPVAPAASADAAASGEFKVQALYDYVYEPVGDPALDDLGYITFKAGDVIEVVNQDDPDWWQGTTAGVSGYFPANLVQAL